MTIEWKTADGVPYEIRLSSPTSEELQGIDGPDLDGQTTVEEVWIDRKLRELYESLGILGGSYRILEH